ncbi:hypothetical protein J6590_014903, partial [Homalodisca vitripennis]
RIVSRNNITGAAADCDHVIPSVDIQFEPTQSDLICSLSSDYELQFNSKSDHTRNTIASLGRTNIHELVIFHL